MKAIELTAVGAFLNARDTRTASSFFSPFSSSLPYRIQKLNFQITT
jgi:hypothetical protein